MNRKRKNVAVYGSCITKDPFTSFFNETYKERYNCIINDQRHSFISTMQEVEDFKEEDLKLDAESSGNKFLTKCMVEDLNRTFITAMLENDIDYLVFDVNFEVVRGIVQYNGNKYMSAIKNYDKTEFYKGINVVQTMTMQSNPEEYFELWKEYCDKFFDFLNTKCPNTKVVLAEVRGVSEVQRPDGSIYTDESFVKRIAKLNPLFKKLEDYVKTNYEIDVIRFDKHIICKEDHRWGKYILHYVDEYYSNFIKQMDNIVEINDLKSENEALDNRITKLESELDELIN